MLRLSELRIKAESALPELQAARGSVTLSLLLVRAKEPMMQDRPEGEYGAPAQPDIGSKVNGIIEAAEKAAAEIVQGAEVKATARIEELTREARKLRDEADQYARDMREAADSYGTQHRRSAEEEARHLLAEAEAKARVKLTAAENEAAQIERDVGQRHEALKREARMLEERRQRVLDSLRDLAAQLQDALVEPSRPGRSEGTLEQALDVERRR
jgi:vacuolar-type H+-ATPase subunit H